MPMPKPATFKGRLTMDPNIEREIVQGLESFADALEAGENLNERFTCHKVVLDLQPTSYNSDLVKETRAALGLSQALFAQFLGVSVNTVQSWEQGGKPPKRIACRFMDEIRNDPDRWRARFRELMTPKACR